jgi:hypothetical protein
MEEKFDHLFTKELDSELDSEIIIKEENKSSRASKLLKACGWRFLLFLFFSQFICKGLLMIIVRNIMLPLFRNKVDAATLQIYIMICMLPWSIKPLIGLCSDYILLCGFHKRGWLILSLVLGVLSSAILLTQNYRVLVFCFVGINFEIALFDLLSEGKYAEIRRDHKELGSDLTTFTQALQTCGQLVGTCLVGFLSDANAFFALYVLTLVFCALPVGPTLLGWLPEERSENRRCVSFENSQNTLDSSESSDFWEEIPKILVVFICGIAGVVVSILTTSIPDPFGPFVGLGVGTLFLIAILYGSHRAFASQPLITAVALYQVITSLSSPVIGSELDYFYTATPECLADGPHFSYAYYISYTGIVGTAVALSGTLLYHFFLSRLRFRPVLLITTALVCLAGLSDLIIVLRLNIKLGIPDKVAYMVGEAVLEPLLGTLNWIPVSALIALSAPKGMEASCFAFLAGLSNFSRMMSELSGSIVISFTSSLTSTSTNQSGGGGSGVNCNFDSLWWLVLLCHVSFPLIIGVLATWLIPDMRQEEGVDD